VDPKIRPFEIVGVVGNVRSIDQVSVAPNKSFYRSAAAQSGMMQTTLVARTSTNPR
jgi:hypothetical protein